MKFLALLLALAALPAAAEPNDAPLAAALGVQIQKSAGDNVHFVHGSGVYLGSGLILTAAHVVTEANPQDPNVTVIMDGWQTAAKVNALAPAGLDLALLRIDPSEISAQRRLISPVLLCTNPFTAAQRVIVTSEGQVGLSEAIPTDSGNGTYVLNGAYPHGASGGGVFDPVKGCLMGIIIIGRSGVVAGQEVKLSQFIPAQKIAPFLAASLR